MPNIHAKPLELSINDIRLAPDPKVVHFRNSVINYKRFYIIWSKFNQSIDNSNTFYNIELKYRQIDKPQEFKSEQMKTDKPWILVLNALPESEMHLVITPFSNWTLAKSTTTNITVPTKVPNPPKITSFYHQIISDPRHNDEDLLEGEICWEDSPDNDPKYPVTEYRLTIENRQTISLSPDNSCGTFQIMSFSSNNDPKNIFVSLYPCRLKHCNLPADLSQPINRIQQINSFELTSNMLLSIKLKEPYQYAIFEKINNLCSIMLNNNSQAIFSKMCGNSTLYSHWRYDWVANQLFFLITNDNDDFVEVMQLALPYDPENSSNAIKPLSWSRSIKKKNFYKLYIMSVERLLVWSIRSEMSNPSAQQLRSMHLDLGPLWSSSVETLLKCRRLISSSSEVKLCVKNSPLYGSITTNPTVYVKLSEYKVISFAKNMTFCRINNWDQLKKDEFNSFNAACSSLLVTDLRPPLSLWVAMSTTPLPTPTTSTAELIGTTDIKRIWFRIEGENISFRPLQSSYSNQPPSNGLQCFDNQDFLIQTCQNGAALISWRAPKNGGIVRHSFKFAEKTPGGSEKWTPLITGLHEMTQPGRLYSVEIKNLKPGRTYEFGLNLISKESQHEVYPTANDSACICRTPAGIPDAPLNLDSKYLKGHDFQITWEPGDDNGAKITNYFVSIKKFTNTSIEESEDWKISKSSKFPNAILSLPSGKPHWLRVEAANSVGKSPPSSSILVKPALANEIKAQQAREKNPDDTFPSVFLPLTCTIFAVIIILLAVLGAYYFRKKRYRDGQKSFLIGIRGPGDVVNCIELQAIAPLWNQEVNSLYGIDPPDLDSIERVPHIPANNLRFLRYIGCGAFGKVWEGWMKPTDVEEKKYEKVALKVRNTKSLSEEEFKREAILMFKYQHPNIVRLIGVSFDSLTQQCLVLELMELGNLREYLHKARPRSQRSINAHIGISHVSGRNSNISAADKSLNICGKNNDATASTFINTGQSSGTAPPVSPISTPLGQQYSYEANLDIPALISIIRDVVRGCKYLEDQHFVHRDIAARNCLVSHRCQSGRIVKLSDFGLARDVYKNDYYRKKNEPKLPVRWMSPEAIRDGLFTNKSDVWSFAVTCWEVMTLGADPYYGSLNMDVMNMVLEGQVLEKPENCPGELYDICLQCWNHFPEARPTFADLDCKIEEFCQLSKNGDSPFSKPFVQCFPIDPSLRAAGYEGNISTPNTEQTVLTSGETGLLHGDTNETGNRKQGTLEHFTFDDKHSSLGVAQYLKLNSGLPSTLKEESESSSAGTTPNLYLSPESNSTRVHQFVYTPDDHAEAGYIEPSNLNFDDNYQIPTT